MQPVTEIIAAYRAYLLDLIEAEKTLRKLSTREMLALMQQSAALPEFYRKSAKEHAQTIAGDDATLKAVLDEEMKAAYGAWIREHYRSV